jgi:hypothetical protein
MHAKVETAARSSVSAARARRLNSIGNRYWKRRVRARYIMSFELFTRVDHVAVALQKGSSPSHILYIYLNLFRFLLLLLLLRDQLLL